MMESGTASKEDTNERTSGLIAPSTHGSLYHLHTSTSTKLSVASSSPMSLLFVFLAFFFGWVGFNQSAVRVTNLIHTNASGLIAPSTHLAHCTVYTPAILRGKWTWGG